MIEKVQNCGLASWCEKRTYIGDGVYCIRCEKWTKGVEINYIGDGAYRGL